MRRSAVLERRYQWDRLDLVAQQMLVSSGAESRSPQFEQQRFGYDAAGQLTRSVRAGHEERYHYDAAEQHFSYNAEHQLTEVRLSGHREFSRVAYRYDALGRRTAKVLYRHGQPEQDAEVVTFHWQGLQLAGEQSSRTPERRVDYLYSEGGWEPLARVDSAGASSEMYWYHTELNGLPERMTDSAGGVVWEGRFSSWGETEHERSSGVLHTPQNLRFQGQYLDRETGLHYNLFRCYDPDIGRFTQVDPIGLLGGLNTYAYVPEPLAWIDPLGLKCWSSARKDFWKNEANVNPHKYSQRNIDRMNKGLAPRMRVEVFNYKTRMPEIRDVSLEIHHRTLPQRLRTPKVNEPWNLEKAPPWAHEAMDEYRHTGYDLLRIIKGVNSW